MIEFISDMSALDRVLAGFALAAVTLLVRGRQLRRDSEPLGWRTWPLWAGDRRAKGMRYLVTGGLLLLTSTAFAVVMLLL